MSYTILAMMSKGIFGVKSGWILRAFPYILNGMSKNVRIYRPSKNTMQSGLGKTRDWILEYEPETRRTTEPLMGWTASGDTDNQVVLRFPSQEEAVKFASDKGWLYTVESPKERIVRPRNYMDNFRYIPPKDSAKT